MTSDAQRAEVDRNYEVFERLLPSILPLHRGEHALMRRGAVTGYYPDIGQADWIGHDLCDDGVYSIETVKDEPVWLGADSLFVS